MAFTSTTATSTTRNEPILIGFVTTDKGLYKCLDRGDGTEFVPEFVPVDVGPGFLTTLRLWNRFRPKFRTAGNPYSDAGCAHDVWGHGRSLTRLQHWSPCLLCLSERATG